jgi:anti-anti-sigma regulatory factor
VGDWISVFFYIHDLRRKQMFTIETDPSQNLLVIRYSGSVPAEEAARCLEEVRLALPKLQFGFRILADLAQLESMDVACAPYLTKIMDLCNAKNVSAVVRIIPDPTRDIGLNIMSSFHYGGNVEVITSETEADALERLETLQM